MRIDVEAPLSKTSTFLSANAVSSTAKHAVLSHFVFATSE
jgi:hypothetical protein